MIKFQTLLRDFGQVIGMPIQEDITGPLEVEVDEFPVILSLDTRSGSESIVLSAQLGTVPDGSKAVDVFRVMLDANVLWTATADCTLGVNADTRIASICYRSDVDGLDGSRLDRLVAGFVEIARNWANFIDAAITAEAVPLQIDGARETLIRV